MYDCTFIYVRTTFIPPYKIRSIYTRTYKVRVALHHPISILHRNKPSSKTFKTWSTVDDYFYIPTQQYVYIKFIV